MTFNPRPLSALFSVSLMTSALLAQEPAAAIDLKAKSLLDETVTFYRSLDEFQVLTRLTIGVTGAGIESEPDQLSQLLTVRRPDKFSLITQEESQFMGSVDAYLSDGTATLKINQEGVIQTDGIETVEAMFTDPRLGYQASIGGNMLFDQNIAFALFKEIAFNIPGDPWDKNLTKLAFLGEEDEGGQKMNRLSLTVKSGTEEDQKELDMELWLKSGAEPHFVKLKPDMTKFFQEINPDAQGMSMEMVSTWSDWITGEQVPETAFNVPHLGDLAHHDSFDAMLVSLQEKANPAIGLVGQKAPAFSIELLDGQEFKLADQIGEKVVVLDFWATWCGPCVAALPELIAAVEEFKDRDVVLIGVNLREESTQIRKFLKDQKMKLTVGLDTDGRVGEQYLVRSIPQTVIIGKDGTVKKVHIGSSPGLKQRIATDLKEITSE